LRLVLAAPVALPTVLHYPARARAGRSVPALRVPRWRHATPVGCV